MASNPRKRIPVWLAAWTLACAAFCASPPLENRDGVNYNVLLITIDTLRADHLGAYGHDGIATPNIDALAGRGMRFDRAYTTCPVTLPSHVSIHTGTYPPYHGVRGNGIFRMRESLQTLAESLKAKDYATGAVVGSVVLASDYGLDQGFDSYDDEIEGEAGVDLVTAERKADEVTRRALEFLADRGDEPFFLWAHYFDPHTIYEPPARFAEQYPDSLYDGEIAYVDEQVGLLLADLRARGLEDDTLVVLVGDHGEGLGDHGEGIHGVLLYDSTLRVPLIMANAQLLPDPGMVDTTVSIVDVLPTILDVVGLNPGPNVHGSTLVPLLSGEPFERERIVYFETLVPYFDYGWSALRGVRRDGKKLIAGPRLALYDTVADPGEMSDLYNETNDDARRLRFAMEQLTDEITWSGGGADAGMDAERRAELAALGYVSGAAHTEVVGDPFSGPDPEPRVWIVDAINSASYLFLQGRHTEALTALERLRREEPGNPSLLNLLGVLNHGLGRLDEAARHLEALVQAQPDREHHWTKLGVVYRGKGRIDDAENAFRRAAEINPSFTEAIYFLALISLERGDTAKGEAGLEHVVMLDADHIQARLRLGEGYARATHYSDAIEQFEHVLSLDPENPDAHRNLAACYIGLRDVANAETHLREAERLGVELDPHMSEWLKNRESKRP